MNDVTATQYREFLARHKLTQVEFAELFGASGRTGQNWAAGSIPPPVATMIALIDRRPEMLGVLREIAQEREGKANER